MMHQRTPGAGGTIMVKTDQEWEALDHLPARLRAALFESVLDYSAFSLRLKLNKEVWSLGSHTAAVNRLLKDIQYTNDLEIRRFSERGGWGAVSPHVAAGATIQRYDGRRA